MNENEDDDESIFLFFFSRQRDEILFKIEEENFEINA
jgi:hypothetical protein